MGCPRVPSDIKKHLRRLATLTCLDMLAYLLTVDEPFISETHRPGIHNTSIQRSKTTREQINDGGLGNLGVCYRDMDRHLKHYICSKTGRALRFPFTPPIFLVNSRKD